MKTYHNIGYKIACFGLAAITLTSCEDWLNAPQPGVTKLKDFFTSTAGKDDNYESVSRQRVKSQIVKLIETESKDNPLSDQELVEKLQSEGLTISRRIIAKYRDEMGILNSRLRKGNM